MASGTSVLIDYQNMGGQEPESLDVITHARSRSSTLVPGGSINSAAVEHSDRPITPFLQTLTVGGSIESAIDLSLDTESTKDTSTSRSSCGSRHNSVQIDLQSNVVSPEEAQMQNQTLAAYLHQALSSRSSLREDQSNLGQSPLQVQVPPRNFPESTFMSKRRRNEMTESQALRHLLAIPGVTLNTQYGGEDFTSVDLDDFCIYWMPSDRCRPSDHPLKKYGFLFGSPEFSSLKDMYIKVEGRVHRSLRFDGRVSAGGSTVYLRDVSFENLSIGGYGESDVQVVGEDIWLASKTSQSRNVWYRLRKPEAAYKRFHDVFLWVATFCKHVVDYLECHEHVTIHDFAHKFYHWLSARHGGHPDFEEWYRCYAMPDFRRAVSAHSEFLRHQASDSGQQTHPIWAQLSCKSIPRQLIREGKTIVTPFVYSCFKDMWFGKCLRPVKPKAREASSRHQPCTSPREEEFTTRSSLFSGNGQVSVGDVIVLKADCEDTTKWKKNKAPLWFAYVHGVEKRRNGNRLKIIWLYRPCDTTIDSAVYPHDRELFISDHCNCCDDSKRISEREVQGLVPVVFFGDGKDDTKYFVRQQYRQTDQSFHTLQFEHLFCPRTTRTGSAFTKGSTVLIKMPGKHLLEPVILESDPDEGSVSVRFLARFRDTASPFNNELLYSDQIRQVPAYALKQECFIRCFEPGTDIPPPYSYGGSGNYFFIRSAEVDGTKVLLSKQPTFKQAFDPCQAPAEELVTLDLFSGCGNFGRGMEDGGVARMRFAVEIDPHAMHTYHANLQDSKDCKLYLGSVNDYLLGALQGRHRNAPVPGSVGLIIAGSPCQGFSNMNTRKDSETSLRNVSLVTSVISFIDLYRPEYAILENVVSMTQTNAKSGQNAFCQILASLVGLGYQVQQFNCDASMYGAPQSRSRIFIVATAPGLTTLSNPSASHRYYPGMRRHTLGKAPNGEPFGERITESQRAFDFVSIDKAAAGLPKNIDGIQPSVRFPDHIAVNTNYVRRVLMEHVLRTGPFRNGAEALRLSSTPESLKAAYVKMVNNSERGDPIRSKAYARVFTHCVIGAIMANFHMSDSRGTRIIHWSENRAMTVEEVRIAQQFPQDFVLLGCAARRWKMVGNSVPRGLSLALGTSLRMAVEENRRKKAHRTGLALATPRAMEQVTSLPDPYNLNQMSRSEASSDLKRKQPLSDHISISSDDELTGAGPAKNNDNLPPAAKRSRVSNDQPTSKEIRTVGSSFEVHQSVILDVTTTEQPTPGGANNRCPPAPASAKHPRAEPDRRKDAVAGNVDSASVSDSVDEIVTPFGDNEWRDAIRLVDVQHSPSVDPKPMANDVSGVVVIDPILVDDISDKMYIDTMVDSLPTTNIIAGPIDADSETRVERTDEDIEMNRYLQTLFKRLISAP